MNKTDQQADTDATGPAGAIEKISERVVTAYSSAREKAGDAAVTVETGIESSPIAAVLGGLALGAIAGVLLPRLEKEKELLAPLGAKIGDAARAAIEAGKTAGQEALDEGGLSTDALRGQVNKLVEQAIKAAGAAGSAAVGAARGVDQR